MCRSIKCLAHFQPPASDDEVRASAVQFVRKLSGANRPSRANQAAFDRAVDEVARATDLLLRSLSTSAPPRTREEEARKARARASVRYGRAPAASAPSPAPAPAGGAAPSPPAGR